MELRCAPLTGFRMWKAQQQFIGNDHGVEPKEMGRKFTWVTLRYLTLDILGNPFIYTLFCLLLTGVILALCMLEEKIMFILRCFTLQACSPINSL